MSESHRRVPVAVDAFSSGQVGSKIWLAQLLEKLAPAYGHAGPHTIWIYGGWQGVLGFLLLSRQGAGGDFHIERVRSFDLDAEATEIANTLNENWVWREWQFRAFTADCNTILCRRESAADGQSVDQDGDVIVPSNETFGPLPSIVINTSVEHFSDRAWFDRIPKGTIVALQASDFDHDGVALDRAEEFKSDAAFAAAYPIGDLWFSGSLSFEYGEGESSWGFQRRMLIGRIT